MDTGDLILDQNNMLTRYLMNASQGLTHSWTLRMEDLGPAFHPVQEETPGPFAIDICRDLKD